MPSGGKASQTRASTTALALFFLKDSLRVRTGVRLDGREFGDGQLHHVAHAIVC
jgi:hypothetical protein